MQVEQAASDGRFFFEQTADSKQQTARMVDKRVEGLDMNNFRLSAVCCLLFTT